MNFALIGLAGYVAPRHLRAIRETGNELVVALDPNDSVGVVDSFFPDADFFTEFERFDRHVEMLRRSGSGREVHYVSICSPNYLHDAHIRFALRVGAHAICEKPLVLNPWNVERLQNLQEELGREIFTILQLRHHQAIIALKERVDAEPDRVFDVDLSYVTARGRWYGYSWKGDPEKSGGVATNIGIHFFDMLMWVFGGVRETVVHVSEPGRAAGRLTLERARVRWFLSIDGADLPEPTRRSGATAFRSISVDGEEVEFTGGFADLHTVSYGEILAGRGYGIEDARPSIEVVHDIRHAAPTPDAGGAHPMV